MRSAGLIDCYVHISDDDVAGGQGVGGTCARVPLSCNSCLTPVEQMDTHTEDAGLAGLLQEPTATGEELGPGCACDGINALT